MKWFVDWNSLRNRLKTGDLILMHGLFPGSQLIELVEFSPFTHVGMVVLGNDIGFKDNGVYFWESNDLTNLEDKISKSKKVGPMLVSLEERLVTNKKNSIDCDFYCKQLNHPLSQESLVNLLEFFQSMSGHGFPSFFDMGIRMITGRFLKKITSLDKIYCSQLVCLTYQYLNLIDKSIISNSTEPKDFSDSGKIPFYYPYSLNKGFYIKI